MGDRFEKLPRVNTTYENAHEVVKGDPRVDGPYLDEVREREAKDLREWRNRRAKDVTLDTNDTPEDQTEADVKAQAEVTSEKVKQLKYDRSVAEKNAEKVNSDESSTVDSSGSGNRSSNSGARKAPVKKTAAKKAPAKKATAGKK